MNLENFISMKRPWEYNFEFECNDEKYKNLATFERYFTYQIMLKASAYENTNRFIKEHFCFSPICDPDCSNLKAYYEIVGDIYQRLWNWDPKSFNPKSGIFYPHVKDDIFGEFGLGGDTMNSVQTVLGWTVGKNPNDNYSLHCTLACWYGERDRWECTWSGMGAEGYINSYHTLGNFVLVPSGFNTERGTKLSLKNNEKISDFWDRSLEFLQSIGYRRFKSLNYNKYINYFFLFDYVEIAEDGKSYIPKTDLSKGLCAGDYSQDLQKDCMYFFTTAAALNNRRGRFMVALLIIQNAFPDLYEIMQKRYFIKNNAIFNGIDGAAKKILEDSEFEKIPDKAKNILKELAEEGAAVNG